MKRLLLIAVTSLFLSGCISLGLPGIGALQTDPGVRVYKTPEKTMLHITHKEGEKPNYKDMQPILEGVFK